MEKRLKLMVVLPNSDAVALHWARIQSSTPKADNDAWIAACALEYGLTLVTDDKNFEGIQGLKIICHRQGSS
jgi:predicted nucleic acid-binding protein